MGLNGIFSDKDPSRPMSFHFPVKSATGTWSERSHGTSNSPEQVQRVFSGQVTCDRLVTKKDP